MVLTEQIKEMETRREALERCLNIEQKRIDLRNEEEKTQEPNFWDDPAAAREQLRKVAAIKAWVEDYDAVRREVEDLQLMPDFVKEGVVSEAELDEMAWELNIQWYDSTAPIETKRAVIRNSDRVYAKLGTLSRGTLISGEYENGWVKFTYNGQAAYSSADYLMQVDGDLSGLHVTCRTLNVRAGAGTNFDILGTLSRGTEISVRDVLPGWYEIDFLSGIGYVSSAYID